MNKSIKDSQNTQYKYNNLDSFVRTAKQHKSDLSEEDTNSENRIIKSCPTCYKWVSKAVFISLIFLGIIFYFAETEKSSHIHFVNNVIKKSGIRSKLMTLAGDKNILFLGVDSNGKMTNSFFGTRSDTIILINIHKNGKSVNMISIPRDSKVFLSGKKRVDKINSAHALGGPALTVKTVEETFGIDVNNYIVVNYAGVRDFIRAIGGVPVNVEKKMYYTDKTAGLNINIQPGLQVLDAENAEGYLRFRHDARGDIGRIKRQQFFLQALLNRLKSTETIFKAPELMEILGKNIRTDLNLFDLSKLLTLASGLSPEDIHIATFPGHPSRTGPVSYWILDADKTQEIIDRLIYRDKTPPAKEDLSIRLFYPPEFSNELDEIENNIHELGLKVKYKAQKNYHYSQVISHTDKASFNRIKGLKNKISGLKDCQYIVEPDKNSYYNADFTIILSD